MQKTETVLRKKAAFVNLCSIAYSGRSHGIPDLLFVPGILCIYICSPLSAQDGRDSSRQCGQVLPSQFVQPPGPHSNERP